MIIGIGTGIGFPGGRRAAWTPAKLGAKNVIWLRADLGVGAVGTDADTWTCQHSGTVFTAIDAAKRPGILAAGGPGGQAALRFSRAAGQQDTMVSPAIAFPATQYWWCVLTQRNAATDQQLSSGQGNTNVTEPSQSAQLSWYNGTVTRVLSGAAAANGAQVLAWHCEGRTIRWLRNWAQVATFTHGVHNICSAANHTLFIGSNRDVGGWMDADISEHGLLNAAPSAGELASLAAYTLGRYGV